MASQMRPLALITGASTGIGLELAKYAASQGYDLVIAADEPAIRDRADELRSSRNTVTAVEADLATDAGVDELVDTVRSLDQTLNVVCANAGRGLGHAFLDQDFHDIRKVVDTNITGTLRLLHALGQDLKAQGHGHIMITGSIAGFMPGTFQAVYNGTKAFLDSFSFALRAELEGSGVTVTCLMPGATETEFFARADMLDTAVGEGRKDDPAFVAKVGFDAMLRGDGDVVSGWKNKLMSTLALVTPSAVLAKQHRRMAEPKH
jgi:short-subunit dehydrogenase